VLRREVITYALASRVPLPYFEIGSSRPVAAAALAIQERAALIFPAYCSGIRVDTPASSVAYFLLTLTSASEYAHTAGCEGLSSHLSESP
jgi:hypothetical protein